jgi:AMP nucleosidase
MSAKRPQAPYEPGFRESFTDPEAAVDRLHEVYEENTGFLRDGFKRFSAGKLGKERPRACYPFARITTLTASRADTRLAYGFVPGPGSYSTTLTRPDLFGHYYLEHFAALLRNHGEPVEIGVSAVPIPLHFAFKDQFHVEGDLDQDGVARLADHFDLPDLAVMDDRIVNGTYVPEPGEPKPLSLFTGPRVDYSLQRLKHYTATSPEHFQNFVLFTNYAFYIDEFIRIGHRMMSETRDATEKSYRCQYTAFVEPGEVVTYNANIDPAAAPKGKPPPRLPQMPAYHLKRADGSGITLVNIGVGPSNAKTITDHIAVTRPHAWIMLGHCAGLRNTQRLGDYVLAHGYVRQDAVLDDDLPLWVPIPALAEVQVALQDAVSAVTGLKEYELKTVMRTGTIASTHDRNWELRDYREPMLRFSQSRAIALDMESAAVAANGFRFRVPYGTLLCVSDKPLHGQLKLPGMADRFYRERVDQHLAIGIKTMELLRQLGLERLHSRKLRSFHEVAFR